MSVEINKAMILAAGRGTRMRSLTDETPKPLIKVHEKTLIDRIADKIAAQGIKECVVNVCYLGDRIKADLNKRSDLHFIFSQEEDPSLKLNEIDLNMDEDDEIEFLENGKIDVGELTAEYLSLALDPFPHAPDAVFRSESAPETRENAFSVLEKLKFK